MIVPIFLHSGSGGGSESVWAMAVVFGVLFGVPGILLLLISLIFGSKEYDIPTWADAVGAIGIGLLALSPVMFIITALCELGFWVCKLLGLK